MLTRRDQITRKSEVKSSRGRGRGRGKQGRGRGNGRGKGRKSGNNDENDEDEHDEEENEEENEDENEEEKEEEEEENEDENEEEREEENEDENEEENQEEKEEDNEEENVDENEDEQSGLYHEDKEEEQEEEDEEPPRKIAKTAAKAKAKGKAKAKAKAKAVATRKRKDDKVNDREPKAKSKAKAKAKPKSEPPSKKRRAEPPADEPPVNLNEKRIQNILSFYNSIDVTEGMEEIKQQVREDTDALPLTRAQLNIYWTRYSCGVRLKPPDGLWKNAKDVAFFSFTRSPPMALATSSKFIVAIATARLFVSCLPNSFKNLIAIHFCFKTFTQLRHSPLKAFYLERKNVMIEDEDVIAERIRFYRAHGIAALERLAPDEDWGRVFTS